MPATYPNLAVFKEIAGLSGTDDDDFVINQFLDTAIQTIEDMTRRQFGVSAESTRYYDPRIDTDGLYRTLYLDEDLASLTSITNGDGTSIATDQVLLLPLNDSPKQQIQIKESSTARWTWSTDPENSVAITGVWGYSTDVPWGVYQAVIRLASFFYYQKDTSLDVDRPILTANGLYLPSRIPSDVQSLIYPYSKLY